MPQKKTAAKPSNHLPPINALHDADGADTSHKNALYPPFEHYLQPNVKIWPQTSPFPLVFVKTM